MLPLHRSYPWASHQIYVEVDHFAHDQDAHQHPHCTAHQRELARLRDPEQLDVARSGQVDQKGDRRRQTGDDRGGGLRLHRDGLNLVAHLPTVADDFREIAERLGQVTAGLLLDGQNDAEEVRFGAGHALIELANRLGQGKPQRLTLDNETELRPDRLGRLGGNDPQAVVEWQARLDAAGDDIERVGKLVTELLQSSGPAALQEPGRNTQRADEEACQAQDRVGAQNKEEEAGADGHRGAEDEVLLAVPAEPGLLDLLIERQLVAGVFPVLDLLETLRDLAALRPRLRFAIEGARGDGRGAPKRFLMDLNFSRIGPMQLDGMVWTGRFDLMIRTQSLLPAELRQSIGTIFRDSLETVGYAGTIGFQTGAHAWARVQATQRGSGVRA